MASLWPTTGRGWFNEISELFARCLVDLVSGVLYYPILSTVVRHRADFNPRPSLGGQPPLLGARSGSTGFWKILSRVWNAEGIAGLYAGFSPRLIGWFLAVFVTRVIVRLKVEIWPGFLLIQEITLFVSLIQLPFDIVSNRAIVTQNQRDWHQLLSLPERRSFWKLYTLPGILFAQVARTLLYSVIVFLVRSILQTVYFTVLQIEPTEDGMRDRIVLLAWFTPFLCALDVILVRLSLQHTEETTRNQEHSDSDESRPTSPVVPHVETSPLLREQDGYGATGGSAVSGAASLLSDPPVIVRGELGGKYEGLIDCFEKIWAEEGWSSLLRGWWYTYIGLFPPTLGPPL